MTYTSSHDLYIYTAAAVGVSSISPGRRNGGRSTDPRNPAAFHDAWQTDTKTSRKVGIAFFFWPRGDGECRDTFCIATAPSGLSLRLDRSDVFSGTRTFSFRLAQTNIDRRGSFRSSSAEFTKIFVCNCSLPLDGRIR